MSEPRTEIKIRSAYFIKLGYKGEWERDCIRNGIARIGYNYLTIDEINAQDWQGLKNRDWRENYKNKASQAMDINMLAKFVESTPEDVWITFYDGCMWWCRLEVGPVEEDIASGKRFRRVRSAWLNHKINDPQAILSINKIPGSISKVQMFQGAVCTVHEKGLLRRLLSGIPSDTHQEIEHAR